MEFVGALTPAMRAEFVTAATPLLSGTVAKLLVTMVPALYVTSLNVTKPVGGMPSGSRFVTMQVKVTGWPTTTVRWSGTEE